MSSAWPASLPQKPLPYDYDEVEGNNKISQDMDVGPPKSRQRSTSRGPTLNLSFVFTSTQLATFKTFYRTTLGSGALPYEWIHPEDESTYDFIFTSLPSYKFLGSFFNGTEYTSLWKIGFTVEQKV